MKNTLIWGAFIGVLSGLWIFSMHLFGITTKPTASFNPIEITSIFIPLFGLYLGVKSYRNHYLGGKISFLEALVESFKILIAGGILAVAFAIWYINYVSAGSIEDFSGQIFGALLLGLLFSLGISLMLMNKHKNV